MSNNLSVGWKFEKACQEIGFGLYDAGKVMGLSQYKDNKDLCDERWQKYINFCSSIQKNTEEQAIEIIQYAIDNSESENIVVTGGYALNCVANKKYIEHFSNINLHIDPICFDGGISIGLAVYEYKNHDIPFYVNPLEQIYLGNNYNTQVKTKTESIKNIVKHICNGEIIAVFQGRSEAGQRALGNRSIVFDPRNPQGKDIVNKHKQRESFRPFAASILQEDCEEWFDMCGLKSSPYMMYALECKQPDKVPAVIHVDGTSRIQTVSQQQNKNFYKLIKEFKNQTSIPMLLNTSFNCAGDPLVETIEDAIEGCSKMGIKKLYLLDTKKLILI